jgi:hypothetical protein
MLLGISVPTEVMHWLGVCLLVGTWLAYQVEDRHVPGRRRTPRGSGR